MPSSKNAVQKVLDEAGKFVSSNSGVWEHSDWEAFLAQVEKLGFELDDEIKRNVGNILEASKDLYHQLPKPATKKKAAMKSSKKAVKKRTVKKKA